MIKLWYCALHVCSNLKMTYVQTNVRGWGSIMLDSLKERAYCYCDPGLVYRQDNELGYACMFVALLVRKPLKDEGYVV